VLLYLRALFTISTQKTSRVSGVSQSIQELLGAPQSTRSTGRRLPVFC
jgi:hypothetical protein